MKRFLLLLSVWVIPCFVWAGDTCCCTDKCERCGRQSCCQKCCHVVCEWKDVKEYVYTCQCKDVCIPGCSDKCCTQYQEQGCCELPYCPVIEGPKPLYSLWCPSDCAKIRVVTKLYKTEVTRKVPTYKWVVEYCCDKCRCELAANEPAAGNSTAVDELTGFALASQTKASEDKASHPEAGKGTTDGEKPIVPPVKLRLASLISGRNN